MRGTSRRGLAVLLLAAGCAGETHRPVAEIVDSAGTRIVRYDLSIASVPTYRVLSDHDLEIGERDGAPEYTFSSIADLAVSADGRIIVSDGVTRELRVYDEGGTHLRTIGGAGGGPGEFAFAPTVSGLAGDTLFVFDNVSVRISAFLLDGRLIAETSLQADDIGRPRSALRQGDGSYVARSNWVDPGSLEEAHDIRLMLDSVAIEHLSPGGGLIDTVAVIRDQRRLRRVEAMVDGRFRTMAATTPYTPRAVMASDGARVILGTSDDFRLSWVGLPSRTETVLEVRGVEHPATAAQIRAVQEARVREALGEREADPMMWLLNIESLPEKLPAFGNVVVSDSGTVWISLTEYDLSEGLDWLVFTPAGELLGKVRTPPELRLRAIRTDFVVGFVLDELDVPFVRRFPLVPPPSDGS